MRLEISRDELFGLVAKQLGNLFVFDERREAQWLGSGIDQALERVEYCFANTPISAKAIGNLPTSSKYYRKDGEVYFNPFHSSQYSTFLYFLSNSIHKLGGETRTLADRVYYLNKALNAVDLFYDIDLPAVFYLDHPIGTVMGRAQYGNVFSFAQNCTVGSNKGIYPRIGKNVHLMSGAKVVGNCTIGDNVIIAANAYVKDTDIPSCSLVFGASPDLVVKSKGIEYFVP